MERERRLFPNSLESENTIKICKVVVSVPNLLMAFTSRMLKPTHADICNKEGDLP
jgi:hypothetical protein